MLKSNLSSRPFYNERLVTLALALVAVIGAALTYFNYREIQQSSGVRAEYQAKIDSNEQKRAQVMAEANGIKSRIDPQAFKQLGFATHEANALIDQRTFSWTVLLGVLERTLPMDVRLVSISPKFEKGNTKVVLAAIAKHHGDIETFINALYGANGMFYSVYSSAEQHNDDGTFNFNVDAYYLAPPPVTKRSGGRGTE